MSGDTKDSRLILYQRWFYENKSYDNEFKSSSSKKYEINHMTMNSNQVAITNMK